jgi:hypothetical protein
MFPQFGIPAQDGDLVISYNGSSVVTIKNCHIVAAHYEVGSGGQVVSVDFVDERWTWANYSITGRYNYRLPNNWVDPNHEATPQTLATLCFQAMGVANFDVSQLPNDSRPDVNWDHANPAQELEKICSDLGCRVVPQRSTGAWIVQITGVGNNLPDNFPFTDAGAGIDPKQVPDYIKIVSGPVRYQVFLPLSAVARDFDGSWRPLNKLSYAPCQSDPTFQTFASAGFFIVGPIGDYQTLCKYPVVNPPVPATSLANVGTGFWGTDRITLADGTKISAHELASDSVFKGWRVDFTNQRGARQIGTKWAMPIPGITNGPVAVDQLILSHELVQSYTDYLGQQHRRPAFVCGEFFGKHADGDNNGNYPPGTRIDQQAPRSDTQMDDRSSFSLSLDPIDTNRSIITTSSPMMLSYPYTGAGVYDTWRPARLQLCCAVMVRDPNSWQPIRNEYLFQVGSGANKDFCRVVLKDDIQPYVIGNYPTGSVNFTSSTSNYAEVALQSQYYAQSIANEYTLTTSETRTYIGIFPIDMDGAIQQVSYSIDKGGSTTQASEGTEHSWVTPAWEERRQQVARQGIAEKVQYAQNETARRAALIGSYNT